MNRQVAYVEKSRTAPVEDREVFRNLLTEGLELTGMSLREAAREFKTAPGTISRWVNGHSAPALVARVAILKYLRSRVNRIARPLRKRSYPSPADQKSA